MFSLRKSRVRWSFEFEAAQTTFDEERLADLELIAMVAT